MLASVEEKSKYDTALESVKQWNSKMMMERKMRQPYLDNTTGLAQTNCHLWISERERNPGVKPGQVYSYPARRWKKKKRVAVPVAIPNEVLPIQHAPGLTSEELLATTSLEPVVTLGKVDSGKEKWITAPPQYEDIDDFEDFEDDYDVDGDDSDFEDSSSKRKRSKKKDTPPASSKSSSKRSGKSEEIDKTFVCELCPAKYKTRSGLDQHITSTHGFSKEAQMSEVPALERMLEPGVPAVVPQVAPKEKMPNDYCDFCLGDASMNKKSKVPEEMVSCADCGRSGHPTCLQFTDNMKISVRKYPWQCIECKSCGLCGTSENDDQLLFCDDCDRGYHMYCLNPPLSEPPEGNWSCHLCIAEFHGGVKPAWMG
ncbi:zinc finger protein DPF3-like isoform X2 [Watersipora subatra]|uniref:zinc finger protein DPF3-like isoform X2 n=1 Tax=Watersipora subatra TaxID=2589382 RepID=UPI00355B3D7D